MARDITGRFLERRLNITNETYQLKGWALISKIPTPWQVHYDKKSKKSWAVPGPKSTVDYTGVSHGRPIAFDAKSTTERTRFPLNNVEPHQVEYLKKHRDQGGISFLIVEFSKFGEVFYVPFELFQPRWVAHINGPKGRQGKHSIPYNWFQANCSRVVSDRGVVLDYLKHLRIG